MDDTLSLKFAATDILGVKAEIESLAEPAEDSTSPEEGRGTEERSGLELTFINDSWLLTSSQLIEDGPEKQVLASATSCPGSECHSNDGAQGRVNDVAQAVTKDAGPKVCSCSSSTCVAVQQRAAGHQRCWHCQVSMGTKLKSSPHGSSIFSEVLTQQVQVMPRKHASRSRSRGTIEIRNLTSSDLERLSNQSFEPSYELMDTFSYDAKSEDPPERYSSV